MVDVPALLLSIERMSRCNCLVFCFFPFHVRQFCNNALRFTQANWQHIIDEHSGGSCILLLGVLLGSIDSCPQSSLWGALSKRLSPYRPGKSWTLLTKVVISSMIIILNMFVKRFEWKLGIWPFNFCNVCGCVLCSRRIEKIRFSFHLLGIWWY